ERFQSAAEVAELLGKYLAHLQQPGAAAPPVGPAGGVPGPRAGLGKAALLVLLGVALLAGGAGACWLFWRPGQALGPGGADGAGREAPRAWRPLTLEELARLPSPLDALKRGAMKLPEDFPPEAIAVLEPLRFPFRKGEGSHWMTQTRDGRLLAVPC